MLKEDLVEIMKSSRGFSSKSFKAAGEANENSLDASQLLAIMLGTRIGYEGAIPSEPVKIVTAFYRQNIAGTVIDIVDAINEIEPILIGVVLETAKDVYMKRYNQVHYTTLNMNDNGWDILKQYNLDDFYGTILDDTQTVTTLNRILQAQ